jgi:hypothetical protein
MGKYPGQVEIDAEQEDGPEVLEEQGMGKIGSRGEGGHQGADEEGGDEDDGARGGVEAKESFPEEAEAEGCLVKALVHQQAAKKEKHGQGDRGGGKAAVRSGKDRVRCRAAMAKDDEDGGDKPDQVEIIGISVVQVSIKVAARAQPSGEYGDGRDNILILREQFR